MEEGPFWLFSLVLLIDFPEVFMTYRHVTHNWVFADNLTMGLTEYRTPIKEPISRLLKRYYVDIRSGCIQHNLTGHLWRRHQMETFPPLLDLCEGNSPATGEFPSRRPVTQSVDISFIYVWTNGWANHRDAGDLRRYREQNDFIVMQWFQITKETY